MTAKTITKPLTAAAEDGVVIVEGACGTAVTLSPEAALGTGDALIDVATTALGQEKMAEARPCARDATAASRPSSGQND